MEVLEGEELLEGCNQSAFGAEIETMVVGGREVDVVILARCNQSAFGAEIETRRIPAERQDRHHHLPFRMQSERLWRGD